MIEKSAVLMDCEFVRELRAGRGDVSLNPQQSMVFHGAIFLRTGSATSLNTFVSPSISCARVGTSGVCTSIGGPLAYTGFAPALLVFSSESPATAGSPAERVLAEANMPA